MRWALAWLTVTACGARSALDTGTVADGNIYMDAMIAWDAAPETSISECRPLATRACKQLEVVAPLTEFDAITKGQQFDVVPRGDHFDLIQSDQNGVFASALKLESGKLTLGPSRLLPGAPGNRMRSFASTGTKLHGVFRGSMEEPIRLRAWDEDDRIVEWLDVRDPGGSGAPLVSSRGDAWLASWNEYALQKYSAVTLEANGGLPTSTRPFGDVAYMTSVVSTSCGWGALTRDSSKWIFTARLSRSNMSKTLPGDIPFFGAWPYEEDAVVVGTYENFTVVGASGIRTFDYFDPHPDWGAWGYMLIAAPWGLLLASTRQNPSTQEIVNDVRVIQPDGSSSSVVSILDLFAAYGQHAAENNGVMLMVGVRRNYETNGTFPGVAAAALRCAD